MKGNVEGVDVELKLVKNGLIIQTRSTERGKKSNLGIQISHR